MTATITLSATEQALRAAIQATPADDAPRLAYADWLQEHGRDLEAVMQRRKVEARKLKADIVARTRTPEQYVWTDDDAIYGSGWDAKVAREKLGVGTKESERPATTADALRTKPLVVVISDRAPTQRGFAYAGGRDRTGPVMYYRKSSGGKWGRSVQYRPVRIG